MHDPFLVRLLRRLSDLPSASKLSARESFPGTSRSANVGPGTSSMTSACASPLVFEAVDRRDVRMLELGEKLRLALESSQALLVGDEGRGVEP